MKSSKNEPSSMMAIYVICVISEDGSSGFTSLVILGDRFPAGVLPNPLEIVSHFSVHSGGAGFSALVSPADDSPHVRHTARILTH